MALPDLIEIIPLTQPVRAEITVPGSKSITNRALILAALADGEVTLRGALWSEDTEVMVEALKKLGFKVKIQQDPNESLNRIITVKGLGGKIPKSGTSQRPLEIHVRNAGTAARFLTAFLCLGKGVYRLKGVPRMHERPQTELFNALRRPTVIERLRGVFSPSLKKLGYRIESERGNNKLPVIIYGEGAKPGRCRVSISESSQFASALLLCSKVGGWEVDVIDYNPEESPYVAMTLNLLKNFPTRGVFRIEPDASSGSYFWGAGWLLPIRGSLLENKFPSISSFEFASFIAAYEGRGSLPDQTLSSFVKRWPKSGWQIDQNFPWLLQKPNFFPQEISRSKDLGDSIMTGIVLAPFARDVSKFTELGRLRVQECERVVALRTELTKCGARVVEEGDTLTVYPAKPDELHGAEIETYNDHRMAMCFAILGLKVPGIRLKNPSCVKKTFPNFFQKLAAAPPNGLGVEIWEVKDGQRTRKLEGEDLFAD